MLARIVLKQFCLRAGKKVIFPDKVVTVAPDISLITQGSSAQHITQALQPIGIVIFPDMAGPVPIAPGCKGPKRQVLRIRNHRERWRERVADLVTNSALCRDRCNAAICIIAVADKQLPRRLHFRQSPHVVICVTRVIKLTVSTTDVAGDIAALAIASGDTARFILDQANLRHPQIGVICKIICEKLVLRRIGREGAGRHAPGMIIGIVRNNAPTICHGRHQTTLVISVRNGSAIRARFRNDFAETIIGEDGVDVSRVCELCKLISRIVFLRCDTAVTVCYAAQTVQPIKTIGCLVQERISDLLQIVLFVMRKTPILPCGPKCFLQAPKFIVLGILPKGFRADAIGICSARDIPHKVMLVLGNLTSRVHNFDQSPGLVISEGRAPPRGVCVAYDLADNIIGESICLLRRAAGIADCADHTPSAIIAKRPLNTVRLSHKRRLPRLIQRHIFRHKVIGGNYFGQVAISVVFIRSDIVDAIGQQTGPIHRGQDNQPRGQGAVIIRPRTGFAQARACRQIVGLCVADKADFTIRPFVINEGFDHLISGTGQGQSQICVPGIRRHASICTPGTFSLAQNQPLGIAIISRDTPIPMGAGINEAFRLICRGRVINFLTGWIAGGRRHPIDICQPQLAFNVCVTIIRDASK